MAEMFRNSVQGVFTRMAGVDEGGLATKALGVMGFASVLGAANLIRTASPVNLKQASASSGGSGGGISAGFGGSGSMGNSMYGESAGAGGGMPSGIGGAGMPHSTVPFNTLGANMPSGAGNAGMPTGAGGVNAGMPTGTDGTASAGMPLGAAGGTGPGIPGSAGAGAGSAGLGMVRAANTARTVGSFTKTAAGLTAGLMFAAVPGGDRFANAVSRGLTGAASSAGFMYGVGRETLRQYREQRQDQPDYSLGQAFRDVTGAGGSGEAVMKTAKVATAEGMAPIINDPQMAQNTLNKVMPSLDGHRWRT